MSARDPARIAAQFADDARIGVLDTASFDGLRLARLRMEVAMLRGVDARTIVAAARAAGMKHGTARAAAEALALKAFPPFKGGSR